MIDPRQRAQMLDEALDVIAGLWSGKPFHYDGRYYHVKEVQFGEFRGNQL
jgi:alkanesulfonate monooxygenase SsuD/methylene tetrahydromethanopterin reductase-like flavin-dependent oxidoreductase (luciferase family)